MPPQCPQLVHGDGHPGFMGVDPGMLKTKRKQKPWVNAKGPGAPRTCEHREREKQPPSEVIKGY